jgi:hypothetical protein
MMRRRTESIPEITFDGDFHFGQTDHDRDRVFIAKYLFDSSYLGCTVLNCEQLRLEVLIECLDPDVVDGWTVMDVHGNVITDRFRKIVRINNLITYPVENPNLNPLHNEHIKKCMKTSLTNQRNYMQRQRRLEEIEMAAQQDSSNESDESDGLWF